ncbi:hypothetical protein HDU83_009794 [Entophlyctis luteolus]|nr:hypothetical protein HDU82_000817 [Entophlyctis luteolus]KAJ3350323.1 hypothetical protein HDU83_009794 [Entophlyctis luteolus]
MVTAGFVALSLAVAAAAAPHDMDKRSACIVSNYAGFASCASSKSIVIQGDITVPANEVINWSKLQTGTTVNLAGTVNFAKGTLTKNSYLITVGGSDITFYGTGTLNGNGQEYWDGKGANGGVNKPKMFRVTTTGGSTFSGFTIKNTPIHCFSIAGSGTTFEGITIDNFAGDAGGGHNTDGFDIGASNIVIKNCKVHNQDDCIAINQGSNIVFTGNTCVGGHGISIGSVQSGSIVENIAVSNCTVANSLNGVRIKTVYQATAGSVSNVLYKDIYLSNIAQMGIVVRQDYLNGGPTGKAVSNMPITNLTLSNIHGTVKSGAYSVFVLCATGKCTKLNWNEINIDSKLTHCSGATPVGC